MLTSSVCAQQHLEDIVSARISITRRSAALPFIILGLLLTILPSSRPTFDSAFSRLFEIAESTTLDITDSSRVHAMNTIRTVFLDAKGGLAAAPYVERGFLVSISLFWSPKSVRTASHLLSPPVLTPLPRRAQLDLPQRRPPPLRHPHHARFQRSPHQPRPQPGQPRQAPHDRRLLRAVPFT